MASDAAAFPALARAKQRFLRRQHAAKQRSGVYSTPAPCQPQAEACAMPDKTLNRTNSGAVADNSTSRAYQRATDALVALCSDFDDHLRHTTNDILLTSASVRRDYHRESRALDSLTAALASGSCDPQAPATVYTTKPRRCQVRLRSRRPIVKLQVAIRPRLEGSTALQRPLSPPTRSRAAVLALEAVNALVLQTHCRKYLYGQLYLRGSAQLNRAVALAVRCRLGRSLRHMRRVVQQLGKFRGRRECARQRLAGTIDAWARDRAARLSYGDGKYALAKEFHRAKLVVCCFQAWLGLGQRR